MDRDDLIECCVLAKNAREGIIDQVQIPKNCLDVLSQQVYGMAIQQVWNAEELFAVIKRSYCYKELTREDFFSVIDYLAGEYALEARDVYAKIWHDKETGQIGKRGMLARMIYMTNIGTIPEESFVNIVISGGERKDERVGMIDEGFLERLKQGDVFVLNGDPIQAQDMADFVSRIAAYAREQNENFLVFPQNGSGIINSVASSGDYLDVVDGIGAEDTFYNDDDEIDGDLDEKIRIKFTYFRMLTFSPRITNFIKPSITRFYPCINFFIIFFFD